ncbi:sugar isomerase domain-containing protein [Holdemanella porci]|uniref:sugar isomerase domain-containing protein n=1 Tax=Holdemanella porci TaxID=2652276 RepID=UPI003AB44045
MVRKVSIETCSQESRHFSDERFKEGHKFFVSGSGHSHTMAEEMYARAGGLAFVVPIFTMTEHPTKSSHIERLSGYAKILAELYGISCGDVVLIASNSGRNAYPIELALEAKSRAAHVVAITSMKHTTAQSSRHSCGKNLYQIADIVIDNCGEVGDCALSIDGLDAKFCPTSSMANSFIAQCINVACAEYLIEHNVEVPVFSSLNCDGTEERNNKLFKKYTRMY